MKALLTGCVVAATVALAGCSGSGGGSELASPATGTDEWIVYTSPRDGWSVEMPGQPEVGDSMAQLFTGV